MRRDVFISTDNVSEFARKVGYLENPDSGESGFVLVRGQAGRGKTETTRNYQSVNGGIFLRVMQGVTQTAFLQDLCAEVVDERPRSAAACKRRLIDALVDYEQTLFIDEADRLHIDRIEDLRDIHDETGVTVVLIGETGINGLLSKRRRIWSRVKQIVDFGPVGEEDVALLGEEAAGLIIGPEACARIVAQGEGDFRLVWSLIADLERAAKAHGKDMVDVKLVNTVAKNVVSWRKNQ